MCPPVTTVTEKPKRPHSVRVRVTDEELAWLRSHSQQTDRSISTILRRALRCYYGLNGDDE
jgi:hypothetical protein